MPFEHATFAGGCFWCTHALFEELRGVQRVVSGYTGGHVADPTYEQVCTGETGHAEAIDLTFDPKVIGFEDVVEIFLLSHDPTTLNRQGHDVGTQYRSAIFYHSAAQQHVALSVIERLTAEKVFADPIVTEVVAAKEFYEAEHYHQEYYQKNPEAGYCQVVISPKIHAFRKKFAKYLAT